jgi:hypothetical protein
MNIWNDGAKQQMQVVDSIVSAGSIRPGGRAPEGKQKAEDFDDALAF